MHAKRLPRGADYSFLPEMWLSEGAARALTQNPFSAAESGVRIHLVTIDRYIDAKLMIWSPGGGSRQVSASATESSGVVFDVQLAGRDQHRFLFKFVDPGDRYEPDEANRLWCAQDGREIWILPESPSIRSRKPEQKVLIVHFQRFNEPTMPVLHIWQKSYLLHADKKGTPEADGWVRFEFPLYTEFSHEFMFFNPERDDAKWESEEAKRNVHLDAGGAAWTVDGDGTRRKLGTDGVWTVDGDHELFGQRPSATKQITLDVAVQDPSSPVATPALLDVWINRARNMLHIGVPPDAAGGWTFSTYPDVVTSFRFRSAGVTEQIERHYLKVAEADASPIFCYLVTERADPLPRPPLSDLFKDPPFAIERPGAWIAQGKVELTSSYSHR